MLIVLVCALSFHSCCFWIVEYIWSCTHHTILSVAMARFNWLGPQCQQWATATRGCISSLKCGQCVTMSDNHNLTLTCTRTLPSDLCVAVSFFSPAFSYSSLSKGCYLMFSSSILLLSPAAGLEAQRATDSIDWSSERGKKRSLKWLIHFFLPQAQWHWNMETITYECCWVSDELYSRESTIAHFSFLNDYYIWL